MFKFISVALLLLIVTGCDLINEIDTMRANSDDAKVWVFAQFNVPEENDELETYYYYGEVSKTIYDAVSSNRLTQGFISLKKVKYWGNDDRIHAYEDEENTGDIIFRIENISRMMLVKGEPALGHGYETPQVETPKGSTENAKETVTESADSSDTIEFNGIVKHMSLEGGFYAIIADDGTQYKPISLPDAFKQDGVKVKVTARLKGDIVSVHMFGTIIELIRIETL